MLLFTIMQSGLWETQCKLCFLRSKLLMCQAVIASTVYASRHALDTQRARQALLDCSWQLPGVLQAALVPVVHLRDINPYVAAAIGDMTGMSAHATRQLAPGVLLTVRFSRAALMMSTSIQRGYASSPYHCLCKGGEGFFTLTCRVRVWRGHLLLA